MFENIICDDYNNTPVNFYFDLENCKFGCIFNQRNKDKEKEYTEKKLLEKKEIIKSWFKEWKEKRIEKTIMWGTVNKKIYQIRRAYYLDIGQINLRKSDFGYTILINPYIKDTEVAEAIFSKLQEVA